MVEQMTIFEVPEELQRNIDIIPFDKNDNVRIVILDYKKSDPESYYYLLGYERKRGRVMKVVEKPSLQYHVEFDGRIAIVYHDELKYW